MAVEIMCYYFKFGHCRYGDTCRRRHNKIICAKENCEIFNCEQRHPKLCRYFKNYGRCKFYPCAFRLVSQISNDSNDGIKDIKDILIVLKMQ